MNVSSSARRFFSPSHHLWVRATVANKNAKTQCSLSPKGNQENIGKRNNSGSMMMDVGLTLRGLEDIGDINTITSKHDITLDKKIDAGDGIVEIEWDGHIRSEADELYHTVWETFTKATTINSPISGIIRYIAIIERPSIHTVVDEETTLFRVEVDHDSYQNMSTRFVNEEIYLGQIKNLPRGIFHEERDSNNI